MRRAALIVAATLIRPVSALPAAAKGKVRARKWKARLACNDEAGEESPETDIFEKQPDGSFQATNEGKTTHFVRCATAPGK